MIKNQSIKLGTAINGFYLGCVILFSLAIAYHHVKIITHAYPLDYNEAGMLVITSAIARGENPFSLGSQPAHMSVYPVLYNILVAPLSILIGNTLELHRAIAGLFILACASLCFYLCRKESVARVESYTAAALFYSVLLFYSTPIASPNGLGLFLFLCALTVPWIHGFSTRSLCISMVLGILAFYTKQYFIACLGYVALYLFIAESKMRAIYFSLATLIAFSIVLTLVCYSSPYFLGNTIFSQQVSTKLAASNNYLISQLSEFLVIYLPLLIILGVATIYKWIWSTPLNAELPKEDLASAKYLNLANLEKPLLLKKPNYIWICCFCSVLIVVISLGKSQGNHLTYLFQLISPFLLVGIFALISDVPKWRSAFKLLIVLALYNSYALLDTNFSVDDDNWRAIRNEIADANDVYASTLVLKEIEKKGAPVYQNGHSRYFVFGLNAPSFPIKSEPGNSVVEVWERHVEFIQQKIQNQEFDLLLIDQWMPLPTSTLDSAIDTRELLNRYYRRTANITLPLAKRAGGGSFGMEVWKPIPATQEEVRQQ